MEVEEKKEIETLRSRLLPLYHYIQSPLACSLVTVSPGSNLSYFLYYNNNLDLYLDKYLLEIGVRH